MGDRTPKRTAAVLLRDLWRLTRRAREFPNGDPTSGDTLANATKTATDLAPSGHSPPNRSLSIPEMNLFLTSVDQQRQSDNTETQKVAESLLSSDEARHYQEWVQRVRRQDDNETGILLDEPHVSQPTVQAITKDGWVAPENTPPSEKGLSLATIPITPNVTDYPTDYRGPWIDDNGLLRARTGSRHRTRKLVENDVHLASALTSDGPLPFIVDIRAFTTGTPGAWAFFNERVVSLASAIAFLVSDKTPSRVNTISEIINSHLIPCRVFTDDEPAIDWLKSVHTNPTGSHQIRST